LQGEAAQVGNIHFFGLGCNVECVRQKIEHDKSFVLVPWLSVTRYGKPPNRKSYQIRRLTSGFLKWEGPHSRGSATVDAPVTNWSALPHGPHLNPVLQLPGGMLSGILEDDDGWFVAQLTTNQNETMGRDLSRFAQ